MTQLALVKERNFETGEKIARKKEKLGQLSATSICGNDITSSCLYVAAISITYAGALAPISLAIVAIVLFLYRKVYAEVGTGLPLNGGAYNCLLNTTSKFKASVAACMSILSYMATAVVSAKTGVSYLSSSLPALGEGYIIPGTIVVLLIFAVLTIIGITESAIVATGIFLLHLATLVVFAIMGVTYMQGNLNVFQFNWASIDPDKIIICLFFGFSAALLGISGFESSANFIEEQKPGVFVKTLRNMWGIVSVFNPLIAVISLGVLPIAEITKNPDFLLSEVARGMGAEWLKLLISVDATLVLSGAVLTSFVGVSGLIRRMTLDRCLPQFLLIRGRRKTNYLIPIVFFLLCTSIIMLTKGELFTIAAVYTISFLGVMCLFAIGNMLLKVKRNKLKRQYRASWLTVIIAFSLTAAGIIGNILIEPRYVIYFLVYFLPALAVVAVMFKRLKILQFCLAIIKYLSDKIYQKTLAASKAITKQIDRIAGMKVIYFTRGDSKEGLRKVMEYVSLNESIKEITFIHCYREKEEIPTNLEHDIRWIDEAFSNISIDFRLVKGKFGPEMIQKISKDFHVPKNYMFIGTPGENLEYTIEDIGEVRLII